MKHGNAPISMTRRHSRKAWACALLIVGAAVAGAQVLSMDNSEAGASNTQTSVAGAHWVLTRTVSSKDGSGSTTVNTDGWYKLPDKMRIEDESYIRIWNGTSVCCFDKKKNTYRLQTIKTPKSISPKVFTPSWDLEMLRSVGKSTAQTVTEANVSGRVHKNIAVDMPKESLQGRKTGRQKMQWDTDSQTGLVQTKTTDCWDYDTDTLIVHETVQYDYDSVIPDSLFVFVPPAGATETVPSAGK